MIEEHLDSTSHKKQRWIINILTILQIENPTTIFTLFLFLIQQTLAPYAYANNMVAIPQLHMEKSEFQTSPLTMPAVAKRSDFIRKLLKEDPKHTPLSIETAKNQKIMLMRLADAVMYGDLDLNRNSAIDEEDVIIANETFAAALITPNLRSDLMKSLDFNQDHELNVFDVNGFAQFMTDKYQSPWLNASTHAAGSEAVRNYSRVIAHSQEEFSIEYDFSNSKEYTWVRLGYGYFDEEGQFHGHAKDFENLIMEVAGPKDGKMMMNLSDAHGGLAQILIQFDQIKKIYEGNKQDAFPVLMQTPGFDFSNIAVMNLLFNQVGMNERGSAHMRLKYGAPIVIEPVVKILSPMATNDPKNYQLRYSIDGRQYIRTDNSLREIRIPPGELMEGKNHFHLNQPLLDGRFARLNFVLTVDTISPAVVVRSKEITNQPDQYILNVSVDGKNETIAKEEMQQLRVPRGPLQEGENYFKLERTDIAGNKELHDFMILQDTIAPEIFIQSRPITNDPGHYILSLIADGREERIFGSGLQLLRNPAGPLTEGKNLLQIVRTDLAGNTSNQDFWLKVDTRAPIIRILGENITNQPNTYRLPVKLDDIVRLYKGQKLQALRTPPGPILEGRNQFQIICMDAAENVSMADFILDVDTVAPKLEVMGNTLTNEPRKFALKLNVDGKQEFLTGKDLYAFRVPAGPLQEGDNLLRVVKMDQASNASATDFHVMVDTTAPHIEVLSSDITYDLQNYIFEVKVDGTKEQWTADQLSALRVPEGELENGENILHLVRKDAAGNETTLDFKLQVKQVEEDVRAVAGLQTWQRGQQLPEIYVNSNDGHGILMPDFGHPDVATWIVQKSGKWSEIFRDAALNPEDIVLIPENVHVLYDVFNETPFKAVAVRGILQFDNHVNTRLTTGTVLVYGGGELIMRNANRHVKSEMVFTGAVNLYEDPDQVSLGLVGLGGQIQIEGAVVTTPYSAMNDADAGTDTIIVKDATNWLAGDELYFPDSQWNVNSLSPTHYLQDERRKIAMIRQVWNVYEIILDEKLDFDHKQAPVSHAANVFVANLSRNVKIYSHEQSPQRGHLLFHGPTKVSIKNTQLKDLGRTTYEMINDTQRNTNGFVMSIGDNQRGRYAFNTQFLDHAFTFEGNVLDASVYSKWSNKVKWGIAMQQSFGSIRKNVIISSYGAAFAAVDGNEAGIVDKNFVAGVGIGSGENDTARGYVKDAAGNYLRDFGHGGYAFWLHGAAFLKVTNNTAVGMFKQSAFTYRFPNGETDSNPKMPLRAFEGRVDQLTVYQMYSGWEKVVQNNQRVNMRQVPIKHFRGNLVDAYTREGNMNEFWYSDAVGNVLRDFTIIVRDQGYPWKDVVRGVGVRFTEIDNILLDNVVIRGTRTEADQGSGISVGVMSMKSASKIINSNISGFLQGVFMGGGGGVVRKTILRNESNIVVKNISLECTGQDLVLENVTFQNFKKQTDFKDWRFLYGKWSTDMPQADPRMVKWPYEADIVERSLMPNFLNHRKDKTATQPEPFMEATFAIKHMTD